MAKEFTEKEKRLIFISIALIALAYIDYSFFLKGQIKIQRRFSQELKQIKSRAVKYKKSILNLKQLQARAKGLKENELELKGMVFTSADQPLFLDSIYQKADSFGVKIMRMAPYQAAALKKEKSLNARKLPGFEGYMFKLELSGQYHRVGEFIAEIEKNPFISIVNLNIVPSASGVSGEKVNMALRVYMQSPGG